MLTYLLEVLRITIGSGVWPGTAQYRMCNLFLLVLLLLLNLSCYCQVSFNIRRYEDGDEVASTLTNANYCSSIQGRLDGALCKCNNRLTFSLDHQRCIDYYNVTRFRFSRTGLLADVSVSVVNIAVDTTGGAEQYALQFTVSPDAALPIAQGTGNTPLPTGCSISSIEFNTPSGWVANSFSGFALVERDSASYLEINELPTEGVELFYAQFVRLNITCPNSITGSLMFKFGGSQNFTSDACEPNPCENSATCIPSDNTFVCNCTDGFTGVLCQSVNYCASNPCQNGGSCVNGLGTHLCFCRENFAGELCDMPTDDIEDHCDSDDDGNSNTNNRTCSSFSVIRRDGGDRVYTPLSSEEYCRSIRAYCPDGSCSYCQCEFRLTYRHDLQRCDDYYNECQLRFSRLTLSVDTGVSTVNFAENDQGFEITFEATSFPLPIVQGTTDYHLPLGCMVNLLAVNRATGWRTVNHGGFSLRQSNIDTFLQIHSTPSLGAPFFNSEFVQLNVTCQGMSYGCLPMKFGPNGDPKNSTYSTDLCNPNPCNNAGSCNITETSFTCSCTPNYSGPLCDDFDHCSTQPCQNGATCQLTGNTYNCSCADGWGGVHCDYVITMCQSDSCANGGTCSTNGVNIVCTCTEGYTGIVCDMDVDDCINNTCTNGATCIDSGVGNYTCTCVNGYSGEYCSVNIDDCDPNHCRNGATCIDHVDNFTCQCSEGYTGHLCHININDCSNISCENNGTCIDGVSLFACQCQSGFTGDHCETNINECDPNPCENGGSCVDGIDSYSCTCLPGYTGENCTLNIDDCNPNPCENGGNCTDGTGGYLCICSAGFTGDNCTIDCPCMNGGSCVDGIADGTFTYCVCLEGFTGDNCEINIDECANGPCINGRCMDEVNGYTCVCNDGYTGVNCDQDIDECGTEDPCANGVCINTNGSFTCDCEAGFTGMYCSEGCVSNTYGPDCAFNCTCLNGATECSPVNGVCNCTEGYTGSSCESAICTDPCINEGICIEPDVCQCPEPYGGLTCAVVICNSDFCANGGTCRVSLVGLTCRCPSGFDGERCETRDQAVSGRNTGDEETSQTVETAVGVSVGLVVVLVGIVAVIIVAIIVYTKYYSRKRKPNTEQVCGLENFSYGTLGQIKPFELSSGEGTNNSKNALDNSDEVVTDEAVYETIPENDEAVQNVDHNQ